jgi:putative SOS response-associated peptidase YedK
MCNLYSMTKGQKGIIDLTRAMIDQTGNLPPLPGIFPDYGAPIVREGPDGRELVLARWGMPSPLFALKGKIRAAPTSQSPHWRRWLEPGKPLFGTVYQLLGKRANARRVEVADLVCLRP